MRVRGSLALEVTASPGGGSKLRGRQQALEMTASSNISDKLGRRQQALETTSAENRSSFGGTSKFWRR